MLHVVVIVILILLRGRHSSGRGVNRVEVFKQGHCVLAVIPRVISDLAEVDSVHQLLVGLLLLLRPVLAGLYLGHSTSA